MNKFVKPIAVTGVNVLLYTGFAVGAAKLVEKIGPRIGFPTDEDFEDAVAENDFKRQVIQMAITVGTGFMISLIATALAGYLTVKFGELVFPNAEIDSPVEVDV